MNTISLAEFNTVYSPVTNKVFEDGGTFKIAASFIRVLENNSIRILESDELPRLTESDEEYAIIFDLRDIASVCGHIIERRLWSLYSYDNNGATWYQIVAGESNVPQIENSYKKLGYIVTNNPYRVLTIVEGIIVV